MHQEEIKFKVKGHAAKLAGDKICYQGMLIHNHVLGVAETRRLFAEYMQMKLPQAQMVLEGLVAFMAEQLGKGNRLDFGGFCAELRLRGGFSAANAPFDPNRNEIGVELRPGKSVKEATSRLRPVNVTVDKAFHVYHTYQRTPFEALDVIAREGERVVEVSATCMAIRASAADEGVWIENDAGERLVRLTYLNGDVCVAQFKLTETLAPGLYWTVVCSRTTPDAQLQIGRRRLTVA